VLELFERGDEDLSLTGPPPQPLKTTEAVGKTAVDEDTEADAAAA